MAKICSCCGKKCFSANNINGNIVCDNCKNIVLGHALSIENTNDIKFLNATFDKAISAIESSQISELGKGLLKEYITNIKNVTKARIQKQDDDSIIKQQADWLSDSDKQEVLEIVKQHQITTTNSFENYKIVKNLSVISANILIGFQYEDILEKESNIFDNKMEQAKANAIQKLKIKSASLGGNAIVGISFDCFVLGGGTIAVSVNGTSVIIEETE